MGSVIVVIWPFFEDFGGWFKVYSMVPAFTLSCISIIGVSLVTGKPADSVQEEYKSYKLGLNK